MKKSRQTQRRKNTAEATTTTAVPKAETTTGTAGTTTPGHKRAGGRTKRAAATAVVALAAALPIVAPFEGVTTAAASEASGFFGCRSELVIGRDAGDGPRFMVHRLDPGGWDVELADGGSGWGPSRATTALALGDIDGDNDPELIVGRNGAGDGGARWEIIDHDGVGWATVMGTGGTGWGPNRSVTALVTADVDGDGVDEIVVGRNGGGGARFEIIASNGGVFDTILADGGSAWGDSRGVTALAAGDIDGDGDDEIAIGRSGTTNMRYQVLDLTDAGFESILDDGHGWGPDRVVTGLAMGDIDGDGDDELAIGRNPGINMALQVRDFTDEGWTDGAMTSHGTDGTGTTAVAFGDIDGDGRDELAVGIASPFTSEVRTFAGGLHNGNLVTLNHIEQVESFDDSSRLVTTIAMGDVDGDGDDDIAIGRNEGENMRFAVHRDGETPLLIDGGDGWGENRGTTALALPDVTGDRDGDFISDCWEVQGGVDFDEDGVFEVELPLADPDRPNLYIELDCMEESPETDPIPAGDDFHTHCPDRRPLQTAMSVFMRADEVAPDGSDGFHIVVDVGDLFGAGVEHQWSEYDGAIGLIGDFGGGNKIDETGREIIDADPHDEFEGTVTPEALREEFFNPDRAGIYRYGVWAHQTNFRREAGDCTGGLALGNTDMFLVTLGGEGRFGTPCYEVDGNGQSVGDFDDHAGVFVHELAHKLGRGHGGHEDVNYKPNYLSNMNYLYNRCEVPASPVSPGIAGGCDLSDMVLPTLDEFSLDECAGIDGGLLGYGWFDWNGDGEFQGETCQGTMVQENVTEILDINEDRFCVTEGPNGYLETVPNGNDVIEADGIADGPDRICETTAQGDDKQARDVGHEQERYLVGAEDWSSMDLSFSTHAHELHGSPDPHDRAVIAAAMAERIGPDIELAVNGVAPVEGGVAELDLTVVNTGGGPATATIIGGKAVAWSIATSSIVASDQAATTVGVRLPWWDCDGQGSAMLVTRSIDLFGNAESHFQLVSFSHDNTSCGWSLPPLK